jgi:hypothetical protein
MQSETHSGDGGSRLSPEGRLEAASTVILESVLTSPSCGLPPDPGAARLLSRMSQ